MPEREMEETHDHIKKIREGDYDQDRIGEKEVYSELGVGAFMDVDGKAIGTHNGKIADISDIEEARRTPVDEEEEEIGRPHLGKDLGPTKALFEKARKEETEGKVLEEEEIKDIMDDAGWEKGELKEFLKKGAGLGKRKEIEKKVDEMDI